MFELDGTALAIIELDDVESFREYFDGTKMPGNYMRTVIGLALRNGRYNVANFLVEIILRDVAQPTSDEFIRDLLHNLAWNGNAKLMQKVVQAATGDLQG